MTIGILLGAGASYGSDNSAETPPLGGVLYDAIKGEQIGPRVYYEKDIIQLDNPAEYDRPPNKTQQSSITVDEWVGIVSQDAKAAFMKGDFERGMLLIDEEVDRKRKERIKKGGYIRELGSDSNEFGDICLTEKIMRVVAQYLYQFSPSPTNIYRTIMAVLPNRSCILTLNYDALIEEIAVQNNINLIEPDCIDKVAFSSPSKELFYFQLHGGVTLCTSWKQKRLGMAGFQMNSTTQRIQHVARIGQDHYAYFHIDDYIVHYRNNAVLSYYNRDKYVANCPQAIATIQATYREKLLSEVSTLIVIGCRYVAHDEHIWKAIENFSGEIFWCGSSADMVKTKNNQPCHIGDKFSQSLPTIIEIIDNHAGTT